MNIPDRDSLIAMAREQTGLSDFGDSWFFANIDALIPSLNAQAKLSPAGVFGAQHMIVSGLVNRLRHIDLLKQHPQILDEEVSVTAVRWYEAQNYVPLDGEARPLPPRAARRQRACLTICSALFQSLCPFTR